MAGSSSSAGPEPVAPAEEEDALALALTDVSRSNKMLGHILRNQHVREIDQGMYLCGSRLTITTTP